MAAEHDPKRDGLQLASELCCLRVQGGVDRARLDDVHDQSDGEDETAENLEESRVGGVERWRATLDDF